MHDAGVRQLKRKAREVAILPAHGGIRNVADDSAPRNVNIENRSNISPRKPISLPGGVPQLGIIKGQRFSKLTSFPLSPYPVLRTVVALLICFASAGERSALVSGHFLGHASETLKGGR